MIRTRACIEAPPPALPELYRETCQWAVCYDETNAKKLATWSYAISDWAEATWLLCKESD